MEHFFVCECIEEKLSVKLQAVIAGHILQHLGTELRNRLDNLANIIQADNITQTPAIMLKPPSHNEHFQAWSRSGNMNTIDHHKMSSREVEELDI